MKKQYLIILLILISIVLVATPLISAGEVPTTKPTVTKDPVGTKIISSTDEVVTITYEAKDLADNQACLLMELISDGCENAESEEAGIAKDLAKGVKKSEIALGLPKTNPKKTVNIQAKKLEAGKSCIIQGTYKCGSGTTIINEDRLAPLTITLQETIKEAEQCNEKNAGKGATCRDKEKGGGPSCKDDETESTLKCTNSAQVCCIQAKCESNTGYVLVDQKDEDSKCMEDSLIQAPDAKEGKICCKNKEKVRESVKEPGTLGRLNSCFGKYWLWGKDEEDKFLSDASTFLDGVKDKLKEGKCANIITNFKATIYNPDATGEKNILKSYSSLEKRSNAIDAINKGLSDCRTSLAPKAGAKENPNADALKALKKTQDNLEKARGMTTMTPTEIGATVLSCAVGMTYASKLAFGNYIAGPALGFGGGIAGGFLGGEKGGIFGKDVTAILGNAAGGLLASFSSPSNLADEMGSCSPETPIKGSELCSTCNEDLYRLCTRERCNILGNCIPVPTAKGDQVVCIPGKCEEVGMPTFTQGKVEWYVDTDLNGSQALSLQGGNIRTRINDGKVIPFNTKTIMINVTTDKPAKCRYILDQKGASFSQMTDFEENEFPALAGGKAGSQATHIILSGIITRGVDHTIFIKCQNSCGVEPNASYDQNIVTFKLEQKPDQLPPNIIYVDPASGSMIRSDLQTVDASFWLDEKGNCRFADKSTNYSAFNYSKMIPFGAYNNPDSSVISGSCDNTKPCLDRNDTCARCTLKLDLSKGYELTNYTGTEFNTTKTYHLVIRCNDQKNNVMTADDALDYILMTAPGYNITITQPPEDNMITYDVQPEIQVTSDPRQTQCKYKIYNLTSTQPNPRWEDMTFIDNDLGIVHTGKVNETLDADPYPGHGYTLTALCRDKFNMEARAWRHFYVAEDIESPILIRTYHDSITGDFLVIETDEPSLCTYSFDSCNFNFTQGILMTGNTEVHGTYWKDKTYFIKCVDAWGNYPSASGGTKDPANNYCTATLKPFEIPKLLL